MRDWFIAGLLTAAASLSPWLFLTLCRQKWIWHVEQKVLERKYGDLSMFRSYFTNEALKRKPPSAS